MLSDSAAPTTTAAPGVVTPRPRTWLRAEGLAVAAAALLVHASTGASWWLIPALFLVPDLSVLGYLAGDRVGAWTYDLTHTAPLPVALSAAGLGWDSTALTIAGAVGLAHVGVDRLMGYGVEYDDGFATPTWASEDRPPGSPGPTPTTDRSAGAGGTFERRFGRHLTVFPPRVPIASANGSAPRCLRRLGSRRNPRATLRNVSSEVEERVDVTAGGTISQAVRVLEQSVGARRAAAQVGGLAERRNRRVQHRNAGSGSSPAGASSCRLPRGGPITKPGLDGAGRTSSVRARRRESPGPSCSGPRPAPGRRRLQWALEDHVDVGRSIDVSAPEVERSGMGRSSAGCSTAARRSR